MCQLDTKAEYKEYYLTTNKKKRIMKHGKLTIFVLLCIMLFSCSTRQTIIVKGEPKSVIYTPNLNKITVIDDSGTAEISISSNSYFAYFLSRKPGTDNYIPFALDYKQCNYVGSHLLMYSSATVGIAGALSGFGALIAAITGSDATPWGFAALGGVACGMPGAAVGAYRLEQTAFKHKYKYLSSQTTNDDIKFQPIKDKGIKKGGAKHISNNVEERSPETTKNSKSSVSKHKIKKSTTLQGTYVGTGKLYAGNVLIEEYDNLRVEINRKGKKNAEVEVFENNSSYFSSKSQYTIDNEENGYNLTLKEIPKATIKIDKDGNLNYNHPRVNIENEIYILKITAKKQN